MKRLLNRTIPCLGLIALLSCGSAAENDSDSDTADASPVDSSAISDGGFKPIFDGKSFTGWEADTSFWHIDNGVLVGEVTAEHQLKNNTFFIYTAAEPGDFELKAEYRISADGNSGIQYRSTKVPDLQYALQGYQADIDGGNVYTGQLYEERGRGFLAKRGEIARIPLNGAPVIEDSTGNSDALKAFIKSDWNDIHLIVKGNHIQHFINGKLMSEATDLDTVKGRSTGLIGLQLHVMPKMKVEYRNIQLKQ